MDLKLRIESDLKRAMLARDAFLVETLRGLKAVILNQEVAGNKRDEGLDDESVEQLIAREVKKRDEAAGLFEQGGNQVAADKERAEKVVLLDYLPKQLDESELTAIIDEVIAETGASSIKDMGQVIGQVRNRAGSAGDGAVIARLIKEKLN